MCYSNCVYENWEGECKGTFRGCPYDDEDIKDEDEVDEPDGN